MHACIGRMSRTKICILIIIKRGYRCKGGTLSPRQSEDPSRFEFFCFISNCLQRLAENIYSIDLYVELYQRKYLIKLFIQYGYEYLCTKSHSRSAGRIGVMVAN